VTRADGKPRITGVEVGELSYTVLGPPAPVFSVKFSLLNAETGDRFGFSNRNTGWSEKTLLALSALVESVEADVCLDLFEGGATSSGGATVDPNTIDGVPTL
jgi:hypothetical protein